jgi:hypothetical protein
MIIRGLEGQRIRQIVCQPAVDASDMFGRREQAEIASGLEMEEVLPKNLGAENAI